MYISDYISYIYLAYKLTVDPDVNREGNRSELS